MPTPNRFLTIHMIQNHVPANLNRDDLGAPKTAYFGGKLRLRISSQCLKRSIRRSELFAELCGGIRSRRLVEVIVELATQKNPAERESYLKSVQKVFRSLQLLPESSARGKKKAGESEEADAEGDPASQGKMLVFTTVEALQEMARALSQNEFTADFVKNILSQKTASPDMALCGRMLETGAIPNTRIEAALQVAHAISTHEIVPEVDYYVAADDIPGEDAGAGFLDEAGFGSATFYKYFCIDWDQLVKNLQGAEAPERLAAHTVAAFLRAAALVHPTGKRTSYAHHNPPDAIVVERRQVPVNYANAFVRPVEPGSRDIVGQSCAALSAYAEALDRAYGPPARRWAVVPFAPHRDAFEQGKAEAEILDKLDLLLAKVVADFGLNWEQVQQVKLDEENRLCTLLKAHSS